MLNQKRYYFDFVNTKLANLKHHNNFQVFALRNNFN